MGHQGQVRLLWLITVLNMHNTMLQPGNLTLTLLMEGMQLMFVSTLAIVRI